jgi:hypothetical protein
MEKQAHMIPNVLSKIKPQSAFSHKKQSTSHLAFHASTARVASGGRSSIVTDTDSPGRRFR